MALAKDLFKTSKLCNFSDFIKISKAGRINNLGVIVSVRTAKHYNPKFKWLRSQKVIKVPLPFTGENKKESFRTKLLKMGIVPRYWKAKPMTITTSHDIFDPYEPPEGDSKISIISTQKVVQIKDISKNKLQTMNAIRKIKNFDPKFQVDIFPQEAQDVYVNAHTVLTKKNAEELSKYVTEYANMKMMEGIKNCTVHWKFIESLESPKVVQARVSEVLKKTNLFAQVTVKFHTKQCLAIYDRFGRLSYGSEILSKDVLEYVVFEKHINNEYGEWRLHAKIIPNWVPKINSNRTYRVEDPELDENEFDQFVEEDHIEPEEKPSSQIIRAE